MGSERPSQPCKFNLSSAAPPCVILFDLQWRLGLHTSMIDVFAVFGLGLKRAGKEMAMVMLVTAMKKKLNMTIISPSLLLKNVYGHFDSVM